MKRFFRAITALLLLGFATPVFAAANLSPTGPAKVKVGQTFTVAVVVSGAKDVDTIRLNGSFTNDLLEWKGASPAGVFQNVSPGTYVDQNKGIFSFGAFTLSSKANDTSRIAVLTFRAKKAGSGYVQLTTNSRVLAAGEDQMGSVGRLNITIADAPLEPEQPRPLPTTVPSGEVAISLMSTTHPDPNAWYTNPDVQISWQLSGKKAKSFFVGFDQAPDGPAETPAFTDTASFKAPSDGVWYAHLLATFADGSVKREDLRVQIDRTLPHPVAPSADQTGVPSTIANFIRFGTTDDVSGIAKYDIYIDASLVTSTQLQTYPVSGLPDGDHDVVVKAFDRAGNMVEGKTFFSMIPAVSTVVPKVSTWYWDLLLSVGLIVIAAILLLVLARSRQEQKKKPTRSRK